MRRNLSYHSPEHQQPLSFITEIERLQPRLNERRSGRYCDDVTPYFIAELMLAQLWRHKKDAQPSTLPLTPALELHDIPIFLYRPGKGHLPALDSRGQQLVAKRVLFKQFAGNPAGLVISPEAYGLILGTLTPRENFRIFDDSVKRPTDDQVRAQLAQGLCLERYINEDDISFMNPIMVRPYFWPIMKNKNDAFTKECEDLREKLMPLLREARRRGDTNASGLAYLHEQLKEQGFNPPPFGRLHQTSR